jgi:hypothetical protein
MHPAETEPSHDEHSEVHMKMVKSLLLGSAAGVVAVAGAQAADLPVKARPVEYVKICSLYGDGFYYIPGTDMCVRFAGNAQWDVGWNTNAGNQQPTYFGLAGTQTRESFPYEQRARGDFDVDTRTQTAYGTLRSFARLRIDVQNAQADGTTSPALPRAFIQWAGWTLGRVKSLSDVPGFGDDGARSLHQFQIHNDTGANGNTEISYSWELGNGMALHIGAGERRVKSRSNLSTVSWTNAGANPTSSIHGQQFPNPYVAFKVSQAWGRWDTSVTASAISANYYTGPTAGFAACTGANAGTTFCDSPSDTWGWAVASGLQFVTPCIAPGDLIGFYGAYGVGAANYASGNNLTSPGLYAGGNNLAIGALADAVYLNGTGFELSTTWTGGGYFTHYWTPQFTSTIFGAHTQISYNDTVINGRWFCGGGGAAVQGVLVPVATKCDPGFGFTVIGTHTDWYPVPSFRLGVELLYTHIDTAFGGSQITLPKNGARPAGAYTAKDEGIASVVFRAQRQWPAAGG